MRRALTAAIAALTLTAAGTTVTGAPGQAAPTGWGRPQPAAATPTPGSPGLGDSYFPDYGNGGYDVGHYDIRLRYEPATDRLSGTTTILATATKDLSRFNLDFALDVESVRVNGWAAGFARAGDHELVVTPARPLAKGQQLTVVVRYAGVPSQTTVYGYTAWTRTADGALAVNEPESAWWWYPSNDHPKDKATWDVSVSVPTGVEVISNGVQPRDPLPEAGNRTRWSWRSVKPGATYQAFLAIGQYDIVTDTAPNGQPVVNAYSTTLGERLPAARASIERTAEIVDWESGLFGPYPFEAQGGVAGPVDGIGFALETQTRPVYGPGFWRRGANTYVVVHENAHQWFGDSVSVADWRHIWLNEGFASYAEWLWSEEQGEGTAQELFDFTYDSYPADSEFWQVRPGDPGPSGIFDAAVYDRGAMALHQIRLAVGDAAFFRILRTWTAKRQYGNGTVAQFQALAERISGRDLDAVFTTWLFTPGRPDVATAARTTAAPAQPASWAKIRAAHDLLGR
ncbi:M1 family metallopeptidase [Micromonospora aurantiaca (nom. illeg.)]|uniref:M1 family metallopeptidase n=1 Tax=Micromonospora aurantiaca (nom. illeg.) TaxID=47850 RepID=UPI0001BF3E60|nr:M1 family metallopeptidase [Micromonospora aurantiaca]ADL47928.1 Peptidase M1 membrane alanine aminopeptidase [Micromonospora aurantiaca ATCC 27029]